MALGVSAALFPIVDEPSTLFATDPDVQPSLLSILSALMGELLLGLAFGWSAQIVFMGLRFAGQEMEVKMGISLAQIVDPQAGGQRGILTAFFDLLAALIFFSLNGHVLLFHALLSSYQVFPLAGEKPFIAYGLVTSASEIFSIGLRVSAPIIIGLLLSDIILGVMSRAVPQMNVFFVGLPLQLGFGLLLVYLSIPTIAWFFVRLMEDGRFTPSYLLGVGGP